MNRMDGGSMNTEMGNMYPDKEELKKYKLFGYIDCAWCSCEIEMCDDFYENTSTNEFMCSDCHEEFNKIYEEE